VIILLPLYAPYLNVFSLPLSPGLPTSNSHPSFEHPGFTSLRLCGYFHTHWWLSLTKYECPQLATRHISTTLISLKQDTKPFAHLRHRSSQVLSRTTQVPDTAFGYDRPESCGTPFRSMSLRQMFVTKRGVLSFFFLCCRFLTFVSLSDSLPVTWGVVSMLICCLYWRRTHSY
jgi:hypothetical protein